MASPNDVNLVTPHATQDYCLASGLSGDQQKWNPTVIILGAGITSLGSGVIITAAERMAITTNTTHATGDGSDHTDVSTNTAKLATITDVGSGVIISATERVTLATSTAHIAGSGLDHSQVQTNATKLATITDVGSGQIITTLERAQVPSSPSAGQIGYAWVATATGTAAWTQLTTDSDPNHRGYWADLATLQAASPLDPAEADGNFAILINSGLATVAVWDIDAGPAAWVELAGGAVTSINFNGGLGVQTGVISVDADDVGEGATNLWLTVTERANIATATTHVSSTGDDHTYLDQDVTSGSSPTFAVSNFTGSAAGLDSSATTHAASDGSSHTFLNQDVTIGASPVLAITNTTGTRAGIDSNATAHAAGDGSDHDFLNQSVIIGSSPTFDLLNCSNLPQVNRLSTKTSLTFTTALAFDAASALIGEVTLAGNTKPSLITNLATGETATYAFTQDSTGGRHIDWDNFQTSPLISKAAGSVTIVKVFAKTTALQHARVESKTATAPSRMISYPSGANFTTTGGGAETVYDNVETHGYWTWPEVRRYQFIRTTDMQWTGPNSSQAEKDKVNQCVAKAPGTKILAMIRMDLWWFFDEAGVDDAAREWGTIVAKPTAAMGEPVRDANAWSIAQTQIEAAGYTQESRCATLTNNGALLTSPYQITLDAGANEWHCRNNVMKVNDDDWLSLLADNVVAQRKLEPAISGYYVQPSKLQLYQKPGSTISNQLSEWLEGLENVGWDLATNTGGTEGAWPAVGDAYDDRPSTLLDIVEGSRKLARLLREKDPHSHIIFSPFYYGVNSYLNSVYRGDFADAYIAQYGGDVAESEQYWADLISDMASFCDGIEFPADDDANNFSADWSATIRQMDKWMLYQTSPQDISDLAEQ